MEVDETSKPHKKARKFIYNNKYKKILRRIIIRNAVLLSLLFIIKLINHKKTTKNMLLKNYIFITIMETVIITIELIKINENLKENFFLYYILCMVPTNLISQFGGKLFRCRLPQWLLKIFIKIWIKHYKVKANEMIGGKKYDSLNSFFTRQIDLRTKKNLTETQEQNKYESLAKWRITNNEFLKNPNMNISDLKKIEWVLTENDYPSSSITKTHDNKEVISRIYSPSDSVLTAFGEIPLRRDININNEHTEVIENIKEFDLTIAELLANYDFLSKIPLNAKCYYSVFYLSPGDYHRFHCPTINYKVDDAYEIDGPLYPVNSLFTSQKPKLLSQNLRQVATGSVWFNNSPEIEMFQAFVAVGAFNVGSIQLHPIDILSRKIDNMKELENKTVFYQLGNEIGWFNLGSTIVLIHVVKGCDISLINENLIGSKVEVGQPCFYVTK